MTTVINYITLIQGWIQLLLTAWATKIFWGGPYIIYNICKQWINDITKYALGFAQPTAKPDNL